MVSAVVVMTQTPTMYVMAAVLRAHPASIIKMMLPAGIAIPAGMDAEHVWTHLRAQNAFQAFVTMVVSIASIANPLLLPLFQP